MKDDWTTWWEEKPPYPGRNSPGAVVDYCHHTPKALELVVLLSKGTVKLSAKQQEVFRGVVEDLRMLGVVEDGLSGSLQLTVFGIGLVAFGQLWRSVV